MAKDTPQKTTQEPAKAAPQNVSEYEASEIAKNSQALFGYSPDLATAALKMANIKMCTVEKARTIIKTFAERKV